MYLLCCSDNQLDNYMAIVHKKGLVCEYLPLMKLVANDTQILHLSKIIDAYAYVLLVSPNAIEFCKDEIIKSRHCQFLVMGNGSFYKLRALTSRNIYYPKHGSGILQLYHEVLGIPNFITSVKKLLVLKGNHTNMVMSDLLQKHFADNYEVLEIYHYEGLWIDFYNFMQKKNTIAVEGIIITSSYLVDQLFNNAVLLNYQDKLRSILFITMHENIKNKLLHYGVISVELMTDFLN